MWANSPALTSELVQCPAKTCQRAAGIFQGTSLLTE